MAGNSYRYNSLQIDGAVNNDLFGLASSAGTPGGTAETQPISLDAIQEIQLVVSPYDVRQGGFSGGGINAITKSGTNDIHGTAFFFGRNQDWVGKGVSRHEDLHAQGQAGRRQSRRSDRRRTRSSTSAPRNGRASSGRPDSASRDAARRSRSRRSSIATSPISRSSTGTPPGPNPAGEFPKETDSDKYFVRGDFNLHENNQLTIRNNYINGLNDISTRLDDGVSYA